MPEPIKRVPYRPPSERGGGGRRGLWAVLGSAAALWAWRVLRRPPSRHGGPDGPSGDAPDVPEAHRRRGHEPIGGQLSERGAVLSGIGLLVSVGVIMAVVYGLLTWYDARQPRSADDTLVPGYQQVPPEPHLQVDPGYDLYTLHERETARLYAYGWVDRARGVVHIPINVAMDLVAERGLPTADVGAFADSVLVPTETGWAWRARGVPAPTAPAYLGSSPEPYAPTPELARRFGLIATPDDAADPE